MIRRTTVDVDPAALGRGVLAFVMVESSAWMGDSAAAFLADPRDPGGTCDRGQRLRPGEGANRHHRGASGRPAQAVCDRGGQGDPGDQSRWRPSSSARSRRGGSRRTVLRRVPRNRPVAASSSVRWTSATGLCPSLRIARCPMNQIAADTHLAAAVVVHEACVLIVRRSYRERFLPGAWGVPCGKLDRGESAESGALRELKEETGILGTIVAHTGSSSFLSDYRGRRVRNHQENFIVRPLTLDVVLPSPDQAYLLGTARRTGRGRGGRLQPRGDPPGARRPAGRGRAPRHDGPHPLPGATGPFSSPKTSPARRVRQDRRPAAVESWAVDRPARRRRS